MQRTEFDRDEIAWLAGLLEGEGSFFPVKCKVKGKIYYYPHISVNMCDADIIERIANMFGTKMFQLEHGRRLDGTRGLPIYRAVITGNRAIAFMEAMLNYMGNRRSGRIKETIAKYRSFGNQDERRRKWSCEAIKKRKRDKTGRLLSGFDSATPQIISEFIKNG